MADCYIALGSNLGERKNNISLALEHLEADPAITILRVSSLIETPPDNCPPQPDFINAVIKLETSCSPEELLLKLQEIEVRLGRKSPHLKNHPRTIDLDILLYGNLKIEEDGLQIPHPRMWQREFVTKPLREIAPELFNNYRA